MNRRLELHNILTGLLGSGNVYFQPPDTVRMKYPCIVYGLSKFADIYADNARYKCMAAYTATVIDPNPDTGLVAEFMALPFCRFERHYTAENLNHYAFTIYY